MLAETSTKLHEMIAVLTEVLSCILVPLGVDSLQGLDPYKNCSFLCMALSSQGVNFPEYDSP